MAFSASFSVTSSRHLSQFCNSNLKWKQKRLEFFTPYRRKFRSTWIAKSVLNNTSSSSINGNGANEPARILLERLFAQTQKLEEQIGRDPRSTQVAEFGVNLSKLENGLQAALAALKKKEEDLQEAERKVLLEYEEINRAKKDLERREEEIVAARLKQEKLEEELRQANVDLSSQALEIDDLKLRLKERDREISASRSALSVKEEEIVNTKRELTKKNEEAANAELELRANVGILDETNKIVEKQKIELQQLQMAIEKKEKELEVSGSMQKSDAEKLRVAEGKLEKQTMDWLVAQEGLKKLVEETNKNVLEANETMEEFGRVSKLLSDVRTELVSSQKDLASYRKKMENQDNLLEKELKELEEERMRVMSYMTSLIDAGVEVENERARFRVVEGQNKELVRSLFMERKFVNELQKELDDERLSLEQAIQEMSALKNEVERKSGEFEETRNILRDKESELVEARLEIERLKSERASLKLIIEEKDLEISDAKKMFEEVNHEIGELKGILFRREEELVQAMSMLKEKDENVLTMENELTTANLKFSEAETVVKKIVDFTNEVVLSFNDEKNNDGSLPTENFKWQTKNLEAELEFTRESLRAKEMEVLAAEKALAVKDEELKMVLGKLEDKEKEITLLKGEMMRDRDEMNQLYALAQETIGEKSVGELTIEKLELEAARLEVEAATSALHKITEISRELLNRGGLNIEVDYGTDLFGQSDSTEAKYSMISDDECSNEVESEVSRLLTLTQQLMIEAGISGGVNR